jgi:hypothetical protein
MRAAPKKVSQTKALNRLTHLTTLSASGSDKGFIGDDHLEEEMWLDFIDLHCSHLLPPLVLKSIIRA